MDWVAKLTNQDIDKDPGLADLPAISDAMIHGQYEGGMGGSPPRE